MIFSITTIKIAEGKRDEFLHKAEAMRTHLRQQRGCRDMQVLTDHPSLLPGMSRPRPDVITIIRKWDNEQYIASSFGDKALLDFSKEVQDLILEIEQRFFETA
jgi:quinol monooxygenase YgiN